MSSSLRLSKKASVEHMRRIRRKRLNGIVCLVWFGWHEVLRRYFCVEICLDVVVAEVDLDI